jgi:hypothetical protein
MSSINLAERAKTGELTIEEVNHATKKKLETDTDDIGFTPLALASHYCSIEVVTAILDKEVNIDGLCCVSIY